MPKKRNFLGGMQNYNEKTGEYESALVGGNGKPVEDADGDGKKHEASKKLEPTAKRAKNDFPKFKEKYGTTNDAIFELATQRNLTKEETKQIIDQLNVKDEISDQYYEELTGEKKKSFSSFGKKEEVSEESIESQLKEVHSKLDPLAEKDHEAFVRHLRTGEPYEENEELKELSKKSSELLKQRDELRKNKASENAKKLGRKDFSQEIEDFYSEDSGFQKLVGEDRVYAMHQYLEANPSLDPKKVLQNDIIKNRDKYPKEFEFKDEKFVVSQSGRAYDHFKKKDGKWEHISVGTIFGLGDDLYDKLKTENLVTENEEKVKVGDVSKKAMEKAEKRMNKFFVNTDANKQMVSEMKSLLSNFENNNNREQAIQSAKENIKKWQRNNLLDTNELRDEKLVYFNRMVEYMEKNL